MDDLSPAMAIEGRILTLRGCQVMLDADLAQCYGVETRALKQAVKRNPVRFPEHFAFSLAREEWDGVITICDNPDRFRFAPAPPIAFTEHGVLMAATVLKSDRAVLVSIRIIEAFVKLRAVLLTHADLAAKVASIEITLRDHGEKLQVFQEIVLPLLSVNQMPRRRIGFDFPPPE
jgi:hypothetical protein